MPINYRNMAKIIIRIVKIFKKFTLPTFFVQNNMIIEYSNILTIECF